MAYKREERSKAIGRHMGDYPSPAASFLPQTYPQNSARDGRLRHRNLQDPHLVDRMRIRLFPWGGCAVPGPREVVLSVRVRPFVPFLFTCVINDLQIMD